MCVTNEIFDVVSLLMPNSLRNEKEFCLGNKGIKKAPETQDTWDG